MKFVQNFRSPSCRRCCEEAHLSNQNAGLLVGWLVGNFLRLLGFRKQQLGHFDPFKENKDDGRTPANHLGRRKPGLNNGKNYLSLNWLAGFLPSTVRMLCWIQPPPNTTCLGSGIGYRPNDVDDSIARVSPTPPQYILGRCDPMINFSDWSLHHLRSCEFTVFISINFSVNHVSGKTEAFARWTLSVQHCVVKQKNIIYVFSLYLLSALNTTAAWAEGVLFPPYKGRGSNAMSFAANLTKIVAGGQGLLFCITI